MNETLIISGYGDRQKARETRFKLHVFDDEYNNGQREWYVCATCDADRIITAMQTATLCRECHEQTEKHPGKQAEPSAADGWKYDPERKWWRNGNRVIGGNKNIGYWYAKEIGSTSFIQRNGTWLHAADWMPMPALRAAL